MLNRGEVASKAQKYLDFQKQSKSKRSKYDGILSFSNKFEFIYVEMAPKPAISSKKVNDLSKIYEAILLMYQLFFMSIPESIVKDTVDLVFLGIQFTGATAEVYVANWQPNMQPVIFSIMTFDFPEQVTSLPTLTTAVAKILSLMVFFPPFYIFVFIYLLLNDFH